MRQLKLRQLKATSNELLHLDLVRFIASAGIVYHHSREYFIDPQIREATMARTSGLALFVDLFFVISGFVIAYIYSDHVGSPAKFVRFMQRRIGRLMPLHWLTLALSIVLFWIFVKAGATPKHVPSFRLECIADTAFLMHAAVPCGDDYFNGPSWSVSAEMAMYVAFPFFAILARTWKAAPLVIGGVILAGIGIREFAGGSFLSYDWTKLHPVLRALPSFLIGVGLYHHRTALRYMPAAQVLLVLSLLGLIGAMLSGAAVWLTLVLVYLSAIAAIAADMQGNATGFVRHSAPLGQMTYSIYMWHGLFILVIMNAIGDKLLHGAGWTMIGLTALCYGGIFVCSYLSFIFIETPARRWVDQLSFGTTAPRRKS
jgi:peptidoglycan/LPS O-acetylase OafA/YrhL